MKPIELGPRSKEALSWMILSEVLRQTSLDLDIAVLHPGGGQYDTLSLVSHEGHSLVHINRNGVNALAGDQLVEDIFVTASKSPSQAARRIIAAIKTPPFVGHSINSKRRIDTAVRISNYLAFYLSANVRCEWGWLDSPYDVGPNSVINLFAIPDNWKQQPGLFKDTSWETSIFLILKKDAPVAAINIVSGEFIDKTGKTFSDFVKNYEQDDLLKAQVGAHFVIRDQSGQIKYEDEVHVANLRMSRRIYSEEYLSIPEEKTIYEFSCNEDEAISKWNNAEQFFTQEDLDRLI